MKPTTKIKMLTLLAISVFYSTTSFAQDKTETKNYNQKFKLGFGFNAGAVFDDPYVFSIGGDARLQYDLSKRSSLTLTTGFTDLAINGDDNDLGFIPVKAGFKAFLYEDSFYIMGEVGAAISVTHDYNKTSLLVAPTIGGQLNTLILVYTMNIILTSQILIMEMWIKVLVNLGFV